MNKHTHTRMLLLIPVINSHHTLNLSSKASPSSTSECRVKIRRPRFQDAAPARKLLLEDENTLIKTHKSRLCFSGNRHNLALRSLYVKRLIGYIRKEKMQPECIKCAASWHCTDIFLALMAFSAEKYIEESIGDQAVLLESWL